MTTAKDPDSGVAGQSGEQAVTRERFNGGVYVIYWFVRIADALQRRTAGGRVLGQGREDALALREQAAEDQVEVLALDQRPGRLDWPGIAISFSTGARPSETLWSTSGSAGR